MKKIITFLIAISAFASLHAQTSRDEARRVILGGSSKNTPNTGSSSQNPRDIILGRGNNSYPNSYPKYPSRSGKYGHNKHNKKNSKRCNDDYDDRHDNGKHKGWYKGKGNKGKHHDD